MLTKLHQVVALLPMAEGPTINTQGVVTFIVTKILPIIFAIIGVMLLLGARKQKMSDVMDTVLKVIVAVAVIGAGPLLYAFGGSLVNLFIS